MKKKIFLLAVIMPCILFFTAALFAFRNPTTAVVATKSIVVTDTTDQEFYDMEANAVDAANAAWYHDGEYALPEIPLGENGQPAYGEGPQLTERYIYTSQSFCERSDRLYWVLSMMGGWGNSNHVHYIWFGEPFECGPQCGSYSGGAHNYPCWGATVVTYIQD